MNIDNEFPEQLGIQMPHLPDGLKMEEKPARIRHRIREQRENAGQVFQY